MTVHRQVSDWMFSSIAQMTQMLSAVVPNIDVSTMTVHQNVAFGPSVFHKLDVWHLKDRESPQPTVFYIHGGGFRRLSKDIMWPMAYQFAQMGYTVCSVNYRLAPEFPCPSALQDVLRGYLWWMDHKAEFGGGDIVVVSGDSAGGNLACGLTLATVERFCGLEEGHRRGVVPDLVVPFFPFVDVLFSDRASAPFEQRERSFLWRSFLRGMERQYQPQRHRLGRLRQVISEWEQPPEVLPPFYIVGGARDPIYPDAVNLHHALLQKGAGSRLVRYDAGHNFTMGLWSRQSQACWKALSEYLSRTIAQGNLL